MSHAVIRRMLRDREHWAFGLAYAPSLLLFATSIPSVPGIAMRDSTVLWLSMYATVGAMVPSARLAVALCRRATTTPGVHGRMHRAVRVGLIINWLPHHAAVVLIGLATAIARDGLID